MTAPVCPVCAKRPPDARFRPFCSKRCADIDLGRWFKGGYVVEGQEGGKVPDSDPESGGDADPAEDG